MGRGERLRDYNFEVAHVIGEKGGDFRSGKGESTKSFLGSKVRGCAVLHALEPARWKVLKLLYYSRRRERTGARFLHFAEADFATNAKVPCANKSGLETVRRFATSGKMLGRKSASHSETKPGPICCRQPSPYRGGQSSSPTSVFGWKSRKNELRRPAELRSPLLLTMQPTNFIPRSTP